jgi:hypothetical protein
MTKLFTIIAGLLLLLGAAAHGYRLYRPFEIIIGGHSIPTWYSWPGAAIAAFLGVMVLIGSRR